MITFDTNLLVYAVDSDTPDKQQRAARIIRSARNADVVLTAQVLGEFVNVIRRRKAVLLPDAIAQARRFATVFPVAATTANHVIDAANFAAKYKLQFWDSLIWQVARSAGASFFISEDMQDGLTIEGMTVIDPFNAANAAPLNALLSSEGTTPN